MEDNKTISFSRIAANYNKSLKGKAESITGEITSTICIANQNIAAFNLKSGKQEHLFWFSTESGGRDQDYTMPIIGQMMTVWFNEKAKSVEIYGEKALGVIDVMNLTTDSERKAFEWFKNNPNGPI